MLQNDFKWESLSAPTAFRVFQIELWFANHNLNFSEMGRLSPWEIKPFTLDLLPESFCCFSKTLTSSRGQLYFGGQWKTVLSGGREREYS